MKHLIKQIKKNSKLKVLIPAAGLGTRVGSPESKEMLFRPDGVRFIDHTIALANKINADIHVITREGKNNLIQYLQSQKISYQLVGTTKDWPETLLLSEPYWNEDNLVLLPDTDFKPISILQDLKNSLIQGHDLVAARFSETDYSNWGVMSGDGSDWWGCEKPPAETIDFLMKNNFLNQDLMPVRAWGIFGFKKNKGVEILQTLLESTLDHKWKNLKLKHQFFDLDYFHDLTR